MRVVRVLVTQSLAWIKGYQKYSNNAGLYSAAMTDVLPIQNIKGSAKSTRQSRRRSVRKEFRCFCVWFVRLSAQVFYAFVVVVFLFASYFSGRRFLEVATSTDGQTYSRASSVRLNVLDRLINFASKTYASFSSLNCYLNCVGN